MIAHGTIGACASIASRPAPLRGERSCSGSRWRVPSGKSARTRPRLEVQAGGLERLGVGLAAADRERAEAGEQPRGLALEELRLGHEVQVAPGREADEERVVEALVVGRDDRRPVLGHVLVAGDLEPIPDARDRGEHDPRGAVDESRRPALARQFVGFLVGHGHGRVKLQGMKGGIEVRDLTVRRGDRVVLRDVSFDAPRGQVLALVGASGAGKSTLLRCLNRLAEPESGTIGLDGEDIRRVAPQVLRRRVALVAQAPAMLPGTVADNLAYGARRAARRRPRRGTGRRRPRRLVPPAPGEGAERRRARPRRAGAGVDARARTRSCSTSRPPRWTPRPRA